MTPQENRRRLAALRFDEGKVSRDARKSLPQPIHNSAEALWIKSMHQGGSGSLKPHRPRSGGVA